MGLEVEQAWKGVARCAEVSYSISPVRIRRLRLSCLRESPASCRAIACSLRILRFLSNRSSCCTVVLWAEGGGLVLGREREPPVGGEGREGTSGRYEAAWRSAYGGGSQQERRACSVSIGRPACRHRHACSCAGGVTGGSEVESARCGASGYAAHPAFPYAVHAGSESVARRGRGVRLPLYCAPRFSSLRPRSCSLGSVLPVREGFTDMALRAARSLVRHIRRGGTEVELDAEASPEEYELSLLLS